MPHDEQPAKPAPKSKTAGRNPFRRYPLLMLALALGLAMVGGSLAFAAHAKRSGVPGFDPASVLPQAAAPPPGAAKVFSADTIKQYDGKNGHKCYVAVDGVVYEIPQQGLWQNGRHIPSGGEAYCGADLSQAILHSPHGKSKLDELAKVGSYK